MQGLDLVEGKLKGVTLGDVTSGVIYKRKCSVTYTYEMENHAVSPLFCHSRHSLQQL